MSGHVRLGKISVSNGCIKQRTRWDDAMMIPDMVNITEVKIHDCKGLAQMVFPKGAVVFEDRGYFDFSLILQRVAAKNTFVTLI